MTGTPYVLPAPPTVIAINDLLAADGSMLTWIGYDGSVWPISGAMAPWLNAQSGVVIQDIKGLMGQFKILDQQGARQDGADFEDAVWDPLEIDYTFLVGGMDPRTFRNTARGFIASWDPKQLGRLVWFSSQLGEWWLPQRLLKGPTDTLKKAPAMMTSATLSMAGRADYPFWTSFDSTSRQVATGPSTLADPLGIAPPGWLPLSNRGDQTGWSRFILQGPGIFGVGDADSGNTVTIGPVPAGVQLLVTTLRRRRGIVEMNTNTNMYPLMSGSFATGIAPATPAGPTQVNIPVSVTGAVAGQTQILASLTPYRKWPE
ncbi:hypothetical protein [Speluncibacter jeojiensis]|uniref:Uncharacterized protein n=1 Tax=Speluncibacter jeojiensis TaxID=2710754 RepID=A0A9X4LW92_9ACTN|nr:hypothetical protein [Corynebacteriales bacterium D3-21]